MPQLIVFDVASIRCALPRAEMREVLPLPNLWKAPGLPSVVEGFLNLGGAALPVVSLARLFGIASAETSAEQAIYRHLLIPVRDPAQGCAFLVDRVLDVASVPDDDVLSVAPGETLNGCVAAEIDQGGTLIHLLDLDRILMAQEQAALADLTQAAQSRLGDWSAPSDG